MKCNIPGTAREIVESLIIHKGIAVKQLAVMLGISPKTIYRIRHGSSPLPQIHLNLIQLYLQIFHEKIGED